MDSFRTGCIFWLFIYWLIIGIALISSGKISWGNYIAVSIVVIVAFWSLYKIIEIYEEKRYVNTPCPHGIKGGITLNKCEACARQLEAEQLEATRKKNILQQALKAKSEAFEILKSFHLNQQDNLLSMSSKQFEDTISDMFRKLGYIVKQTPYSQDEGIDAIATKDGKRYVIQCKKYGKDKSIGRPLLQQFFAAMKGKKAIKGYFVTTGKFTTKAVEYAMENRIELIDLPKLLSKMQEAFPIIGNKSTFRLVCKDCGDTVSFSVNNKDAYKKCRNGHTVINEFYEKPILN